MHATMLEIMLEIVFESLTAAIILKVATLFTLAAVVTVALRLGYRHRREKAEEAEQDNRSRNLFQLGASDRAGDRTTELINELRQHEAS
jgi:hypothetical protein